MSHEFVKKHLFLLQDLHCGILLTIAEGYQTVFTIFDVGMKKYCWLNLMALNG